MWLLTEEDKILGPEVVLTPGPHLGGRSEVLRVCRAVAKTTSIAEAIAVPTAVKYVGAASEKTQLL